MKTHRICTDLASRAILPGCAILIVALVLIGCDSSDPAVDDEVDEVVMLPQTTELAVGETAEFDLVPVTAAGDTVREVDMDVRWWSSDSTVFTVTDDGIATALSSDTAFCIAEATQLGKTARRFVGRDSAMVIVFLH